MKSDAKAKLNKDIKKITSFSQLLYYIFILSSLLVGVYLIISLMQDSSLYYNSSATDFKYSLRYRKGFSIPLNFSHLRSQVELTSENVKFLYVIYIVAILLNVLCLTFIIQSIHIIFVNTNKMKSPFNFHNTRLIRLIGVMFIIYSFLPSLIIAIAYFTISGNFILYDNSFRFLYFFVGLLFFALEKVFNYGIMLLEEYDTFV